MPWKPLDEHDFFPTLGWYALDWITTNLTVYDGPAIGEPLSFSQEQADFVLRFYEVDPLFEGPCTRPGDKHLRRGRLVRRALLSRPKGWGKSPLVAAICLLEALGDIVMDGWDAAGQPVGRPWNDIGYKPLVQIVAVSEDQTANTWMPCIDMARNSPVYDAYDIEPMETFINVPRGRIEAVTSAGLSREGFRPVFTAMDQTESWVQTNGGWRLARTIRRNTMKTGGSTIETPNAFEPGEESIAEQSWHTHQTHLKGKKGRGGTKKRDLLLDHREGPATTDVFNEQSLRDGLIYAYGDSAAENGGWVNIDGVIDEFWDEDTDLQEARRYFLNQITHATDSYLDAVSLAACVEPKPVAPGTPIVLGFDGSMGRAKGKADATALVAVRLSDAYCWQVLIREPPNNARQARDWVSPVFEFDTAVAQCFKDFKVVGFYADPSGWEAHVAKWEKIYGPKLRVKASGEGGHPIMAWPRGKTGTIVPFVKRFKTSVLASADARTRAHSPDPNDLIGIGEFTYDGSFELTQHLLNARMRKATTGYLLYKDFPESPRKIDGAYALVLAWKAYLDAVAKRLDKRSAKRKAVTLG